MKINFNKQPGELSVAIDGRLDTVTAPQLESFLSENYNQGDALIIDCEGLSYISSAGLRVLLLAEKRSGGAMKLCKVCDLVMEVLEMTGFADILVIE